MLRKSALLALAVSFLAVADASAQTVRGTILGTVTDSSGAVIRRAKVTVREISTGLTRSELSNDEGEVLHTAASRGALQHRRGGTEL